MEKRKLPFDFSEITQEEIDRLDNYKKVNEYTVLDFLKAIVETSDYYVEEDNNNDNS